MKDVYIVEALRTPFGSFGGTLKDIDAPKLASIVIKELLNRTNLKGEDIDEIIMGEFCKECGTGSSKTGYASCWASSKSPRHDYQ